MRFDQLVRLVNELYPDNMIAMCYKTSKANPNGAKDQVGDTLAVFILNELRATFRPKLSTKAQIEEARSVLERAIRELATIRNNL